MDQLVSCHLRWSRTGSTLDRAHNLRRTASSAMAPDDGDCHSHSYASGDAGTDCETTPVSPSATRSTVEFCCTRNDCFRSLFGPAAQGVVIFVPKATEPFI